MQPTREHILLTPYVREAEKEEKNRAAVSPLQELISKVESVHISGFDQLARSGDSIHDSPAITFNKSRSEIHAADILTIVAEQAPYPVFHRNSVSYLAALQLRTCIQKNERIKGLSFINCEFKENALESIFEGIICSKSLESLHFEGYTNSSKIKQLQLFLQLKKLLANPSCSLKTLNLVNNTLIVEDVEQIVEGIASQTEHEQPLVELCLEGCGLDCRFGKQLKELLEKNTRLKRLILQNNQLGTAPFLSNSPVLKSVPREQQSGAAQDKKKLTAVEAICKGLKKNSFLQELNLAANSCGIADLETLCQAVQRVTVNLTRNGLENEQSVPRVIVKGSSPRSKVAAFQEQTFAVGTSAEKK